MTDTITAPEGQLMDAERKFLFDSVLEARPTRVLEVGTWNGGGSTLQIALATQELISQGHYCTVHTCEPHLERYWTARRFYDTVLTHVQTYNKTSKELIDMMLKADLPPDFVFFDGPEDDYTAVEDFKLLDPHLKSGTVFTMHDWDAPSIKASTMRPYLEQNPLWKIVETLTAPESVGLVKAVKL